jgi:hypothetical protein
MYLVLETPHTIVAAVIAAKTSNPALAIPMALLSHFVLDEMPHWNPHITTQKGDVKVIDPKSMKIIIIDSSLALLGGSAIALSFLPDIKKTLLIFACCFLAVLPDLMEAPYIFLNYKSKFLKKWLSFQKQHQFNIGMFWGIVTQIITVTAALVWLKK